MTDNQEANPDVGISILSDDQSEAHMDTKKVFEQLEKQYRLLREASQLTARTGTVVIQSTPSGKSIIHEEYKRMNPSRNSTDIPDPISGLSTEWIVFDEFYDPIKKERPESKQERAEAKKPSYARLQNKYNTGKRR